MGLGSPPAGPSAPHAHQPWATSPAQPPYPHHTTPGSQPALSNPRLGAAAGQPSLLPKPAAGGLQPHRAPAQAVSDPPALP
eukprot:scaffold36266_cov140-Isochrysis_galbana.AAC.1